LPDAAKNDKTAPTPGKPCLSHDCPLGVHNFPLLKLNAKHFAGKGNKKMQQLFR
jgi:hypothetical protein